MALGLGLVVLSLAARVPVRLPDAPPWPNLQATPTMGYNGWLSATMGHEPGARNQTLYCVWFDCSVLFFFFHTICLSDFICMHAESIACIHIHIPLIAPHYTACAA